MPGGNVPHDALAITAVTYTTSTEHTFGTGANKPLFIIVTAQGPCWIKQGSGTVTAAIDTDDNRYIPADTRVALPVEDVKLAVVQDS